MLQLESGNTHLIRILRIYRVSETRKNRKRMSGQSKITLKINGKSVQFLDHHNHQEEGELCGLTV